MGELAGCKPGASRCGGSTPPVRITTWGRSSAGRSASLATRKMSGSTPTVSINASVVSTASTRPLYGRGAGSTPAGGSFTTRPRGEAVSWQTLVRSSRALADVAQPAEHRAANPVRPVRSGPSALQARGVTGSTASSNLAGPGSIPGGPAGNRSSRAGAARLSLVGALSVRRPLRFDSAIRPHTTTATSFSPRCGPEWSGYRVERPIRREVAGSSPARSSRLP